MQLAFLVTFAFGVLSAWAIGSSEEEEQEWACGTDTVSHWLSEATIEKSCPTLKKSINQCCVNHDQCYEDQVSVEMEFSESEVWGRNGLYSS
ncbi:hypothetical protein L596_007343 [Steinernema carpocapsae]|uniref:Domain of unknown function DB domain-containing protein n=1 Tax=Steinernema carpocapsae TaxID=34508 RepID=A0A4U5P926_STECR|nr:hypothetical protein L596_007343 [Steinernema carpocapsae]